MFVFLLGFLACGDQEATIDNTDVATTTEQVDATEGTTKTTTTANDSTVQSAVYPAIKDVTSVAPDGDTTLSGTDVGTTTETTTKTTNGDAQ